MALHGEIKYSPEKRNLEVTQSISTEIYQLENVNDNVNDGDGDGIETQLTN